MTSSRTPAELVALRKAAQELSAQRKERFSTIHLLAVAARGDTPASELFADRRLDEEAILKAARGISDEDPVAIGRSMTAAREIAKRAATSDPNALHLVLALLADRACAAHRALIELGVDAGRLRAAAMQVALGVVAARRSPSQPPARRPALLPETPSRPTPSPPRIDPQARASSPKLAPGITPPTPPSRGSTSPGVTVPLLPPLVPRRPAPAPRDVLSSAPSARDVLSSAPSARDVLSSVPSGRDAAMPEPAPKVAAKAAPRERAPAATRSASPPVVIAEPARFELDKTRYPLLASLGKNLTALAAAGALRPAIGRTDEIEAVLDVLAKRHASSACIVGPAGVGKTTVAHGVAHRLAASAGPPRALIEISVPQLIAGTGLRGALAEKVATMCAEAKDSGGSILLFFDEVHELFGPSTDEATATLKLALARGEVQIIGATTTEEHRKTIETDAALSRRFSVIEVEEPGEEEAVPLLRAVAEDLGAHHRATYDDEAISASVAWCVRFLPGRALPDKAINVLDLAGARVRRRADGRTVPRVATADVASVVSELSDVPRERLLETDGERMLALERLLADRVVGHADSLARIARVLRRNAAGMRGRRPIGSFLLLGPTGVGKTETAKAIAEALFHSDSAMTRLDLSEFAEAHAVARLVGAPPGYVGHEAGGQLTEAVRKRPYQVVLLDEIEKAHRDVLLTFLQVLGEGHLTDGRGRRVDFTNTVVVLTSNLGAAEAGAAQRERPVGFGRPSGATAERLADVMLHAARGALAPELYNRIDEVLCFAPLTRPEVAEIARRMIAELGRSLAARGVRLDVEPRAIDALLDAGGFDVTLGARPVRRVLARLVEAPLAEMILRGELAEGAVALIDVEDGRLFVDAVPARAAE
jgi:ATP-dependent Clp protease ATP-binding subunit ClpC